MVKFYDRIPGNIIQWIYQQKLFWVATAPLAEDGHVNVSPKGFEQTMHIVLNHEDGEEDALSESRQAEESVNYKRATSSAVWYEDMTGSGNETISHARENGRITVMFTAFEGPPMIVRLFGTARVHEFGSPEYEKLLPLEQRQPGSRAVIWVDIHKVGSSCGYSIPFFTYKGPRYRLHKFAMGREQQELDHRERSEASKSPVDVPAPTGLRAYWSEKNTESIDGLPGLSSAITSTARMGDWSDKGAPFRTPDDESITLKAQVSGLGGSGPVSDVGKVLVAFATGFLTAILWTKLVSQVR